MNGETFGLFTILPDQMQVANPVLILLFIPLFDYVVYPLLSKHIIQRLLKLVSLLLLYLELSNYTASFKAFKPL